MVRATLAVLVIICMSVWSNLSHATTYWTDPSGNDSTTCLSASGDTDPGVYKASPSGAVACMVGGDHLIIKAGFYTGTTAHIRNLPSGTASNPTIAEGDPNSAVGCAKAHTCPTILHPSSTGGLTNNAVSASHAIIRRIDFDHQGITSNSYPFRTVGPCTDVLLEDIETHSTLNLTPTANVSGLMIDGLCDHVTVRRLHSHDNGGVPNTGGHGIYLQGDDVTVEDSWIHDNGDFGVQCYRSGTENGGIPFRCTFRNNLFENNESSLAIEGNNFKAYNNVFRNARHGTNVIIGYGSSQSPLIYNNLFYNSSGGAVAINCGQYSGCTNATIVNNILFGYQNELFLTGTGSILLASNNACESSKNCGTTGKLSIASITDILVSTTDYRLKPGSAAINAGIASLPERPCNDTACDIGPNESFSASSAAITGTTIDVTLGMNLNTPVSPTVDGWSISCVPNPTGCPTPTITGVSLKTGSSTIVSITYSGASCQTGQNWIVNYDETVGNTTDSITLPLKQQLLGVVSLAVSNLCTGSPAPSYPSGALIYYPLDGNANDASGNGNNGVLNGSPTFTSAKHGLGMQTTLGATQYIAIPYGNGINPSTQPLTICKGIYITPGTESTVNFIAFGAPVGTNQRLYVAATSGTWRLAAQSQNSGTASDLAVVAGWNMVCLQGDGAGNLILHNNNVAATSGSGVRTVTSYTLAGNFQLGAIPGNISGQAVYDDFLLWTSVVDLGAVQSAWEQSLPAGCQMAQAAHRFQRVHLINGAVSDLGVNNVSQNVVNGGAVAIIFQINSTVSDCASTSFTLWDSADCVNFTAQVPNTPTTDGVYFWGVDANPALNRFVADGPLTGSLTHTDGSTQLTADATPTVTMAQNTSITLRYIVRFLSGHTNERRCFKLKDQSGNDLSAGYTPSSGAEVDIIPVQANTVF